MSGSRLMLARNAGYLPTLAGRVAVFGPYDPVRLSGFDDLDIVCVTQSAVLTAVAENSGVAASRNIVDEVDCAIVLLPRAKSEALALVAAAQRAAPHGIIIVDGQKTDGVDSIYKLLNQNVKTSERFAKAHGKTFWFASAELSVSDQWAQNYKQVDGAFVTAAGVFSADGIDPASALLIENLPADLSGDVVDLGAGWGILSHAALARSKSIQTIHLVEDNATALECARQNVSDRKAMFHWADARDWTPPARVNTVIMNPPFHTGRAVDASLGHSFIESASRILAPGGRLFMVANGHLPYETSLEKWFEQYSCVAQTSRFKVFAAQKTGRASQR